MGSNSTFSIVREDQKLSPLINTDELKPSLQDTQELRGSTEKKPPSQIVQAQYKVAELHTDTVSNENAPTTISCRNTTYSEGDERNKYITYAANKLIENGLVDGYYNYLDFLATWQHESDWQIDALNTANSNGTSDHGLCQLNSRWHGKYILSDPVAMADPYAQLDYCVGVAVDAKNKGSMPWSAWKNGGKDKHKHKFECTT